MKSNLHCRLHYSGKQIESLLHFSEYVLLIFFSQGSFDSLKATFTLKRRTTYFIFQHFIPSAFLVFLSWLSFWVDRHAVPARISLVITCILSTMFLFESINSSLPRISYLKAVDYYLITSFVFIVSCMVEYVCVLNFPDKASTLLRSQSLAPVSLFHSQHIFISVKNVEQNLHRAKLVSAGVPVSSITRLRVFLPPTRWDASQDYPRLDVKFPGSHLFTRVEGHCKSDVLCQNTTQCLYMVANKGQNSVRSYKNPALTVRPPRPMPGLMSRER